MRKNTDKRKYAQIEYHGIAGVTRDCLNAIVRLIHFGDRVVEAKLLTFENDHCFLLSVNVGNYVAIKSGFGSGYRGTGATGLSTALQFLDRHGADIDEYLVPQRIIEDIDNSCMQASDLELIVSSHPVRPSRWFDYVIDIDGSEIHDFYSAKITDNDNVKIFDNNRLRRTYPVEIPFAIIDSRIFDLALAFKEHPDNSIISGYRRLEDIIRERAGLTLESGHKLFSKAFNGENSMLYWKDVGPSVQAGRASLFTGVYMAFRNPRAHREPDTGHHEVIREFLLLNELFLLESQSVIRQEDGALFGQDGDGTPKQIRATKKTRK